MPAVTTEPTLEPVTPSQVINAQGDYILPMRHDGTVARYIVELISASFVGSVTVNSRLFAASGTKQPVPYLSLALNGAVGTYAYVATAITGTSLIEVDASEMDVLLSCTAYTSGTLTVIARPCRG